MEKNRKSPKSDQNPIFPPMFAKIGMHTIMIALRKNVTPIRKLKEYLAPNTIVHICAKKINPLIAIG